MNTRLQTSDQAEQAADAPSTAETEKAEPQVEAPAVDKLFAVVFQSGDPRDHPADVISRACVLRLRNLLLERVGDPVPRKGREIDLWLESPGGDAHAAYKLLLLLRAYASRVRVVVPDYAKSAATLIAIGCDEIYMAPWAELGPLDVQVDYEHEGVTISALDMTKAIEYLAQTAVGMALSGGAAIVRTTGLSRRETISNVLGFVSSFMNPMIQKVDPHMLHRSASELRVAEEYGRRLLRMRRDRHSPPLDDAPAHLVEHYPTHGFVISPEEAKKMGLPVRNIFEYPEWPLVRQLHEVFESTDGLVSLFTEEEIIEALKQAGGEP